MNRGNSIVRLLVAGLSMGGALSAMPVVAHADSTGGDLFYTTFDGADRVFERSYSFDGSTLTYGLDTVISSIADGLGGADGLVFDPTDNNFLLVGGQNSSIYRVDIGTGAATASSATTGLNYHLAITPDGSTVLGTNIPGTTVSAVSLTPFNSSVANLTIAGDDTVITGIAFDALGKAYYTTAGFEGTGGNFGTGTEAGGVITTTRLLTGIDAHGISFDPLTGDLMLFGDNEVNQYHPGTGIIGTLTIGGASTQFDQGTVDGKGHLFVASNDGKMLFLDYSGSSNVSDGGNFSDLRFFRSHLDDVAPLTGLHVVPEPASMMLFGLGGLGAAFSRRRKFFSKVSA